MEKVKMEHFGRNDLTESPVSAMERKLPLLHSQSSKDIRLISRNNIFGCYRGSMAENLLNTWML